jgi:hypothetical protein
LDEISRQVDEYERKFGNCDRSEFDGEFFVPAEVRNRVNSMSKGSLRIHGGLLTMSRSRTFLTLTTNSRSSIHSSTPDLSRSISHPNTPSSNHKLSLTSSYDSVLEENEDEGVMILKKSGKEKSKKKSTHHVQHIFDNGPLRRKSEDILETRARNGNPMQAVEIQQKHIRQSSDQAYRLIPRVKNSEAPRKHSVEVHESSTFTASTSAKHSTASIDSEMIANFSRWGNVRGSNSFASNLNAASISIPRVSLSHHRAQSNEPSSQQQPKAVIVKHEFRDSHA